MGAVKDSRERPTADLVPPARQRNRAWWVCVPAAVLGALLVLFALVVGPWLLTRHPHPWTLRGGGTHVPQDRKLRSYGPPPRRGSGPVAGLSSGTPTTRRRARWSEDTPTGQRPRRRRGPEGQLETWADSLAGCSWTSAVRPEQSAGPRSRGAALPRAGATVRDTVLGRICAFGARERAAWSLSVRPDADSWAV